MECSIERICNEAIEEGNMDEFIPRSIPTAITWIYNNIFLPMFRFLVILFLTSTSLFKGSSILVNVSIHVFLSHLIFIVQKGYKEVCFLTHSSDMASKQSPVLNCSIGLSLWCQLLFFSFSFYLSSFELLSRSLMNLTVLLLFFNTINLMANFNWLTLSSFSNDILSKGCPLLDPNATHNGPIVLWS